MENPQTSNQTNNPSSDDEDKEFSSFVNFLKNDLEDILRRTMIVANPPPRVVMIQEPMYCYRHYAKIYTRGIVDIGGKHYIMDIIANWRAKLIYIRSKVFGVFVDYDFERGEWFGYTLAPPVPDILKDQCSCICDPNMKELLKDLKDFER